MAIEGKVRAKFVLRYNEEFRIGKIMIKYDHIYSTTPPAADNPPLEIEIIISEHINPSERKRKDINEP